MLLRDLAPLDLLGERFPILARRDMPVIPPKASDDREWKEDAEEKREGGRSAVTHAEILRFEVLVPNASLRYAMGPQSVMTMV